MANNEGELVNFFVTNWLLNGPAVAILQGIPGCGKTQLARSVMEKSARSSFLVLPQAESPDPVTGLITDLAEGLNDEGIGDLKQELGRGANGDLYGALQRILRREKILIIIDEFQCLFSDANTDPPKKWQHLVEALNNTPNLNGRLMFISNRFILPARWCESSVSRKLGGLTDKEAAAFFLELLVSSDLTAKVHTDRLEEIGHRLGGNPRALKTLVGSLRYEALEDLISLAPDLFKLGDVDLDPGLVEDFERQLIERALPSMEVDLLNFMRCMAVHRRPFTKEAFCKFEGASVPLQSLRKQLIDRFLMENSYGYDSLHPLVREISVSRLRADKEEWQYAHSLAANYHFRHFKARQQGGQKKLTTSYSELRHHLFEAGRISELHLASEKLTKFALSQITRPVQSQIPDNVELLEERIALISALPEGQRPDGLEYHLALCLKHRNTGDDYAKALKHVRNAVGPHAYYATWLLLIELEYALNGIDSMLRAQKKALKFLGDGSNAFSVYLYCAQLLEKDARLHDAIKLLEEGIHTPGVTCLSSLICKCATFMVKAECVEDAIKVLQEGIGTPSIPDLGTLYLQYANLLIKENRLNDAVTLLTKGLKIEGNTHFDSIYVTLAEYLIKENKDEDAICLLEQGLLDSRAKYQVEIYICYSELLVKKNRIGEATALLEKGISSKTVKNPLQLYHSFAKISEEFGSVAEGVKCLKNAMATTPMSLEPTLYLACAKLLFHSRMINDAIEVLKQGFSAPGMKDKNHLYKMAAELTAREGHLNEAIVMLEQRIAANDECHNFSLYKSCAELMMKNSRLEDAITFLKKGINAPAQTNKTVLYQFCAKLLAKAGRASEGIDLLEKAMRLPGLTGMVTLYQTCARLMSSEGRNRDAINLLNKAIAGQKFGNMVSLYQLCAELMVTSDCHEDAIFLLRQGLVDYPADKNLKIAYERTEVAGSTS